MSKTPEEMAEDAIRWVKTLPPASERCNQCACEGYRAGYKAAQAIVEEELQAVQAQRAEYPGLGAAQYALKSVLAKMGSK